MVLYCVFVTCLDIHVRKHKLQNKFQVNNLQSKKEKTRPAATVHSVHFTQHRREATKNIIIIIIPFANKICECEDGRIRVNMRLGRTPEHLNTERIIWKCENSKAPRWWTNCEFASVSLVRSNSFVRFFYDVSAHFSLLPFYTLQAQNPCVLAILTHLFFFFASTKHIRQINYSRNCIYIFLSYFYSPSFLPQIQLVFASVFSLSLSRFCLFFCVSGAVHPSVIKDFCSFVETFRIAKGNANFIALWKRPGCHYVFFIFSL